VLVFHVVELSPARPELMDFLGAVGRSWKHFGIVGIDIFFLLSGFVLMRSLSGDRLGAGKFILRRQLRLDPAYWVAIVVTLAVAQTEGLVGGINRKSFSALDLLANFTYLQGVLHRATVLSVSWTLCLEVQMYLALLVIVVATRRASADARAAIILATGLAATMAFWFAEPSGVFAVSSWRTFCVGVMLFESRRDRRWLYAAAGLLVLTANYGDPIDFIVRVGAAGALVVSSPLNAFLESRPIQWVGLRSYSLYLFHPAAIDVVTRPVYKFSSALGVSVVMTFVSIGAAIVAAGVMYRLVEQPFLEIAAQTKTAPLRDVLGERARRARVAIARGR
jgi:peptidoglycan/LPS O-acetylase OafA/YrhL